MEVHFSIDDVLNTLRWCAFNCPKSIFDMDFFGSLKKWHEAYGLKVTLYCFFSNGSDFCIEDLPVKYLEELQNECDWLRLVYHGCVDKDSEKRLFLDEYRHFEEVMGKATASPIVRFHYWKVPDGVLEDNYREGILLCPDYDRVPYDLTQEEWERLKEAGTLKKAEREYWISDIRFDHMESVDGIDAYTQKKRLVIFGHEWKFKEKRRLIEALLEKLGDVEYLI